MSKIVCTFAPDFRDKKSGPLAQSVRATDS